MRALNGHAICLVGQPIYLWPAAGQCLVGSRLARGTKLHTPACQPALPRLSTLGLLGTHWMGSQGLPRHPTLGMPPYHARSSQLILYPIHLSASRSLSYLATRLEKLDPCWRV